MSISIADPKLQVASESFSRSPSLVPTCENQ